MPPPPPITCAITGARGYLGRTFAAALRTAGHRVIELRRDAPNTPSPASDQRPFVLGETLDPAALADLDVLVHCAYDFAPRPRGWSGIARQNVAGTLALFTAARQEGVNRLIFISSMSAYAGCRSLYGRAKRAVEAHADELDLVIVRPGLVYGAHSGGVVGALDRLAARLPVVPLVGRGDQQHYPAHADDLAALIVKLCTMTDAPTATPIIAAGEQPVTLRHIMTTLCAAHGRQARLIPVPIWCVIAALAIAQTLRLTGRLRVDSLRGLLHADPAPDFAPLRRLNVPFRPFALPAPAQ